MGLSLKKRTFFICSLCYTKERQTLYRASEPSGSCLARLIPSPGAGSHFSLFLVWAGEARRNLEAPALTQVKSLSSGTSATLWRGESAASCWGSPQGQDLQSVYAMCTVCKLIFLLAAIKIKDLAIYCKSYFQFYVAFLSYDQGINSAFSLCL